MITDLLLCWYAMGWVACGVDVALMKPEERHSYPKLFFSGPIMLFTLPFATIIVGLASIRVDPLKQYLWRRPK